MTYYKTMKTIKVLLFSSLLTVMATVSCISQEYGFSGPVEEGYFSIGWSGDGNRFAYGWFIFSPMTENSSTLTVIIQDMVTDEVLCKIEKTWYESNVGEGDESPPAPRTADKAWELQADEIYENLAVYGISEYHTAGLHSFPYQNGDYYDVNIEFTEDGRYQVFAISGNLGRKRISSGNTYFDLDVRTEGFVFNPQGSRMAVITIKVPSGGPFITYEAIGCHLRAGFEPVGG
jgi:predicted RNA-binding protein with TRAM domain